MTGNVDERRRQREAQPNSGRDMEGLSPAEAMAKFLMEIEGLSFKWPPKGNSLIIAEEARASLIEHASKVLEFAATLSTPPAPVEGGWRPDRNEIIRLIATEYLVGYGPHFQAKWAGLSIRDRERASGLAAAILALPSSSGPAPTGSGER